MNTIEKQIESDHYVSFPYQPIQFIIRLNLDFIQGNIVKYVTRYKGRGGKEDLKKGIHYASLGMEFGAQKTLQTTNERYCEVEKYARENKLDEAQRLVIHATVARDYKKVEAGCEVMLVL